MSNSLAMAIHERVLLQSWRKGVSIAALQANHAAARQLAASAEGGMFCALTMAGIDVELPDAPTRAYASKLTKETDAFQLAAATVIEGEGFRAAAARAALGGIFLLSRTQVPRKIFSAVRGAVQWLGPTLSLSSNSQRELELAMNELRAQHQALVHSPSQPPHGTK